MNLNKTAMVFALVFVGCGGGGGGNCRVAGQTCSVTTDCCNPDVCTSNICTTPLTCRSSGDACAVTTDCCSGLACLGGKCANGPTCSNTTSCSGGRNYQSCSTGSSTYYKASDGMIFTCATTTNCTDAAKAVVAWCGGASCRAIGQTCALSSDCCNPLTCMGGTCRNAATCRNQGQACAKTADCCGMLVCFSGSCSPAGVTWKLSDLHGARVWLRFYDETANLVWPDNTNAYFLDAGQTFSYPLDCTPGDSICYGAEDDARTGYWGVGLDNQYTCNSCCATCDGKTYSDTLQ